MENPRNIKNKKFLKIVKTNVKMENWNNRKLNVQGYVLNPRNLKNGKSEKSTKIPEI